MNAPSNPLDAYKASGDYLARYYELCDIRDAVNAQNAPIEAELEVVNAQAEALRAKAAELASRIDDNRGREQWIALKREIAMIAKALGKIPPRA